MPLDIFRSIGVPDYAALLFVEALRDVPLKLSISDHQYQLIVMVDAVKPADLTELDSC